MPEHGKKYRALLEKLGDTLTPRSLEEAVSAIKAASPTKFDATVEVHIRTGCDPKQADEMIRAITVLPHGTGKSPKIAVFAEESKHKEAKAAGADIVGGEDLIAEVIKGKIDFEVAIATPEMMKSLAKAAKVLGPKGLMPSPKSGTVTDNITAAVEDVKKGKIELKLDKDGNVHSVLGKVSFAEKDLLENAKAFFKVLKDAKPSGIKSIYLQTITLTTT